MTTIRDVTDFDKTDSDTASYAERVGAASRLLGNGVARLDAIIAGFSQPPDPDKQAIIDSLNSAKATANAAISRADTLLAKLTPS